MDDLFSLKWETREGVMLYCVSGIHRDWLVHQEGSISVTVIRNLMQRGSRENRVSPLSDTFMKRRDISSGHVSASFPQQCGAAERPLSNALSTTSHTHTHHITPFSSFRDIQWCDITSFLWPFSPSSWNDGSCIVLSHISYSVTLLVGAKNEYVEFNSKLYRKNLKEIMLSHIKH